MAGLAEKSILGRNGLVEHGGVGESRRQEGMQIPGGESNPEGKTDAHLPFTTWKRPLGTFDRGIIAFTMDTIRKRP